MGKHKLEIVSSFGAKRMKSKTKNRCGDLAEDVRSDSFFGMPRKRSRPR
jgi:hypothetical protein